MTLSLAFETGSHTFADPGETGRILRELASRIDAGMSQGTIHDLHGDKIGSWSLMPGAQ